VWTPDRITELGSWGLLGADFGRARVVDHWLYLDGRFWPTEPWRLQIYDLRQPDNSQPVAETPDVGVPAAVAADRAYSVGDRVTVLDITRPDRPAVGGWLPVPGSADGIAAAGQHAYLLAHAGWQRVYIIDAADMRQPHFVGIVELTARPDHWTRRFLPLLPQ